MASTGVHETDQSEVGDLLDSLLLIATVPALLGVVLGIVSLLRVA
jgi:hypothetical protein